MYTLDLLEQLHLTALRSVDGLPILGWHIPGVYGEWSVKDTFAHMTGCEYVLLDIMASVKGETRTTALDRWLKNPDRYYAAGIARRHSATVQMVLNEYKEAQAETINQIIRVPDDKVRQKGTLPWYDEEQNLEQLIAYSFYHYKLNQVEHIAAFRDQMLHIMSRDKIRHPLN
jgi:uncharacterized damage-inducible protein DinB